MTPLAVSARQFGKAATALRVRPFVPEDLPAIVRLHRRAFPGSSLSTPALQLHLARIFRDQPWCDPACPSLICEDADRGIIGALGVMLRPMVFHDRKILAAVSHNFMVDPDSRQTLAALRILQVFVSGPQQLSIAEATSQAQRLWSGVHGETACAYSHRWVRPLALARSTRAFYRMPAGPGGMLVRAAASAVDRVAAWTSFRPFDVPRTSLVGEPLDAESLAAGLQSITAAWHLRPSYTVDSLRWLLDSLRRRESSGVFEQVAVRSAAGALVGWYLYFLQRSGIAQVVQLTGHRDALADVFSHLLRHARERGAVAVTGRNDPALMPICVASRCLFRGEPWTLVRATDPAIGAAVHRGAVFLTPLEGEGWIGC